jgi:uncharacterized protein YjbI with pentapeptide repeats
MPESSNPQTCSYWSYGGDRCDSPVYSDSKCILHAELPEDFEQFQRLKEQKGKEVLKKVKKKDFDFEGAILFYVDLSRQKIIEGLNLRNATLLEGMNLGNHVKLIGSMFEGATFSRPTYFDGATFTERFPSTAISFAGATFEGEVSFQGSTFERDVRFRDANFFGHANFIKAGFEQEADFSGAAVKQGATFLKAKFEGDFFPFYPNDVRGRISFDEGSALFSTYKATFSKPEAEEAAYRTAKQSSEALGETASADQSFYREMAAKRKQKLWYMSYPELVVQYGFWYGVRPFWLLVEYAAVWFIFGAIFWFMIGGFAWKTLLASLLPLPSAIPIYMLIAGWFAWKTLVASLYFSFLTLVVPGYGIINPLADTSLLLVALVIVETVIGVFTWPTFIVIFARKFMR